MQTTTPPAPATGPLPDKMRMNLEQVREQGEGPAALLRAGQVELYAWVWLSYHEPTQRLKRLVWTDVDEEVLGHIEQGSYQKLFPAVEEVFGTAAAGGEG